MNARTSIWAMMAAATAVVLSVVWVHKVKPNQPPAQPAVAANPAPTSQSAPMPAAAKPASIAAPKRAGDSPAIQILISEGEDYIKREDALKQVSGKLVEADRETVYEFLRRHATADDRQPGQVLKNEVMDQLCGLQPLPAGLRQLLTDIYQDRNQNAVLRDYSVQHLSAFYRRLSLEVGGQNQPQELAQVRETLWSALAETDTSIAGTALLGLSQMNSSDWTPEETQKLGRAALDMAGDASASDLARITALQGCANLQLADALPVVWTAAQKAATKTEQISAIAALGSLGGEAQQSFLYRVLQGQDEQLKPSAQRALNQIQARLQRNGHGKPI